jgi:RHS repeat-associated protein
MVGMTYDAAGNVTSADEGRRTYKYDSFDMLTRVKSNNIGERRMIYDANDERIGMLMVNDPLSRWTIRDFEGRVIREYKADSFEAWTWEEDNFYGESSLVGGETQGWGHTAEYRYGGQRHYHLDHLGSVRMVTDDHSPGRSISEHEYYPFGATMTRTYQEQLNTSDPHIDSMRFAGHWRDFLGVLNVDNTEYLDNMHARTYDPNLGRFLSVDPILNLKSTMRSPQAWNRYSHVRNNPLTFTDPTGKYLCDASPAQCKAFEAARQANINSDRSSQRVKDASKSYGDLGKDNGITVKFGQTKAGRGAEAQLAVSGDNINGMRAFGVVTVKTGLRGNELQAAVAHEGGHVQGAQAFAASFSSDLSHWNNTLNLSGRQTEINAYRITADVAHTVGATFTFDGGTFSNMMPAAQVDRVIESVLKTYDPDSLNNSAVGWSLVSPP